MWFQQEKQHDTEMLSGKAATSGVGSARMEQWGKTCERRLVSCLAVGVFGEVSTCCVNRGRGGCEVARVLFFDSRWAWISTTPGFMSTLGLSQNGTLGVAILKLARTLSLLPSGALVSTFFGKGSPLN